jgi:hypothetical protein
VNLSHFTVPDMSQIKDLRPPETPKVEKIHILLGGEADEAIQSPLRARWIASLRSQ